MGSLSCPAAAHARDCMCCRDMYGNTALHLCVYHGQLEMYDHSELWEVVLCQATCHPLPDGTAQANTPASLLPLYMCQPTTLNISQPALGKNPAAQAHTGEQCPTPAARIGRGAQAVCRSASGWGPPGQQWSSPLLSGPACAASWMRLLLLGAARSPRCH
jgi:hypothetical protein